LADFGRGIKAGVAVAAVYLIISAILSAIYRNSWSIPYFIYAAGLSPFSLRALTDPSSVIFSLILPYLVRGIIFGAVFAALYSFLPGAASVKKGVVLSLFLCIVALVEIIYTTPGWPTDGMIVSGTYGYYSGTLILSSISLALAGIISALAFGALTGLLWDRFRAKRLAEARKGSPVLRVSFILGGINWVLFAVMFLIGVVILGGPAVNPDTGWSDLLYTSIVFLGLPGWVLTLVGWRKTRRGKSGLKWGVAGGVMMALTGIMLFPGTLAITGGVLSGRKLATELSTAEIEQ
jgi:hypothetical protein